MNILHLVWGSVETYGGIHTVVRELCRLMEERGHPSRMAALPSMLAQHRPRGDEAAALPLLRFESALETRLGETRADVVISHNLHLPHCGQLSLQVPDILSRCGVAHVAVVHDVFEKHAAYSRRFLKDATVVTISPSNVELLRAELGVDHAVVIPPPIDVRRFEATGPVPDKVVAVPARLAPDKGLETAVRLACLLSRDLGPLTLLFSNPLNGGRRAAIADELVQGAAAFPDVTIEFNSAQTSAPMYQRASLIFAAPTVREGFGLTPAESLASGRPAVVVPTGGMVWVREAPGVLVSSRDPLRMASCLAQVLGAPEVWSQRALAGRAWVDQMFGPERACAAYLELCRMALNGAPENASHPLEPAAR